mmetsp:Transcript_105920/g.129214  ORF Transcript_105920/g.129214 Transcript_105920/m.129214 type:complete len:240 (-) Transcript_105920:40-759(-)
MTKVLKKKDNEYGWKISWLNDMKKIGLGPLQGFTSKDYKEKGNKIIITKQTPIRGNDNNGHTWLIYNFGLKTDKMDEYSYDIQCNEGEMLYFSLDIHHQQYPTWITQYIIGLSDGITNKIIPIGSQNGIGILQAYRARNVQKSHYSGKFSAPNETGIYYIIWHIDLQYNMANALNNWSKRINKNVPKNMKNRCLARILVGISYKEFNTNISPDIIKLYPGFRVLLPLLYSFLSPCPIKG